MKTAPFHLVHGHLHQWDPNLTKVEIGVDRHTLAKRRWRATANDGVDFGFDLEHPLAHGDVVYVGNGSRYQIEQQPEPVLTVSISSASEAVRLGWMIGNLHFTIAVGVDSILAPDDLAVRQMLEREQIAFRQTSAVFRPIAGGGHSHAH